MKKHKNKITAGVLVIIVLIIAFLCGSNPSVPSEKRVENSKATATISPSEPPKKEISAAENTSNDIPIKEENQPATEENKPQKQDGTPMSVAEKLALAQKLAEKKQEQETVQPQAEEKREQEAVQPQAEENPISDRTEKILSAEIVAVTEAQPEKISEEASAQPEAFVIEVDKKDSIITASATPQTPAPTEAENIVTADKKFTCTLSVRCDTIIDNIGWLDSEKVDIIPKDGIIFAEQTVTFYEGESVFNLLLREMKRNKIHMEFVNTPIYNSAYIEGIANIYEFDCGELSGWMYKVNGSFPNYGCSRYQLKDGDRVEWVYTCNLGVDVGGYNSSGGNKRGE